MRKSTVATSSAPGYTLLQLVRSDSAALVGYMRHDLVDARKWISEADYKAGLALSLGLSHQFADDHQMLKHGMVMYDALYAWCRHCQAERTTGRPRSARQGHVDRMLAEC